MLRVISGTICNCNEINWIIMQQNSTKSRLKGLKIRRKLLKSFGWGGRIRTSAWRNQNPLPYRLATPPLSSGLPLAAAGP
jgi:hypothetical protein